MFINPQLRPFAAGELASIMKNNIIILIHITDDCDFTHRLRINDFFSRLRGRKSARKTKRISEPEKSKHFWIFFNPAKTPKTKTTAATTLDHENGLIELNFC